MSGTSGVIGTLIERRLVKVVGRKKVIGRPFMYATTQEFLNRFGLSDLTDLPKVEDMADALGLELPPGLATPSESDQPLPLTEDADADADADAESNGAAGAEEEQVH